jgi:hypothetical protein
MTYLVVHAIGTEYNYVTTVSYQDALATYTNWLSAYATAARDRFARNQVDALRAAGDASRGRVVEYRSHSYGNASRPEQVFVLCRLNWPNDWKLPPKGVPRDWGQLIKDLGYRDGAFHLRTNGHNVWRIFWLDEHGPGFTTTDRYLVAAEAAAVFACIEAFLTMHK